MAQGTSTTSPGPILFLAAPLVLTVVVLATAIVVVVRRPPLPLVVVIVVPIPLPFLPCCLHHPVVVPCRLLLVPSFSSSSSPSVIPFRPHWVVLVVLLLSA